MKKLNLIFMMQWHILIAMFILSHVMTKLISVCSKFVILIVRMD